jgi:hypothetical protein
MELLLYSTGFFFFGLGLFFSGQALDTSLISRAQSVFNGYKIPLRPLRFVIAIIIFSGLCNAILLIPAALEAICDLNAESAIIFHQICMFILALCVLYLVILGFISALLLFGFLSKDCNFCLLSWPSVNKLLNGGRVSEVYFIALSIPLYFYAAVAADYVSDTGLYHLPFVNHLVRFGAEIGLANFHSRYGFYNIQLFGQAPIHSFGFGDVVVPPSLNILFAVAFFMFACQSVVSAFSSQSKNLSLASDVRPSSGIQVRPVSAIAFWIAMCSFGFTGQDSLISFDADFSASIVASLVCFSFIVGAFINVEILLLAACLPLLKLSGIVAILWACIFVVAIALCGLICGYRPAGLAEAVLRLRTLFHSWRFPASVILPLYIVYFSTNITLSGYLVFPQYMTGPIGPHAVPYREVVDLKDRWITGWARFMFDSKPREVSANASVGSWLPKFAASRRGNIMLFWIVSSFFVAASSIWGILFKRNKAEFAVLFASATSSAFISALVLLVFPPDPRFYTWIGGLIAFNIIQLFILAPVSSLATFSSAFYRAGVGFQGRIARANFNPVRFITLAPVSIVIAFSLLIVGTSLVLQSRVAMMEVPPLVVTQYAKREILSSWRTRAASAQDDVTIRQPAVSDRCWGAEPPCSPYQGFLKPTSKSGSFR